MLRMLGATVSAMITALRSLATPGRTAGPRVHLEAGDKAPDFTLAASDGRRYRLSDFRGRAVVVIAWYPKAFTAGCSAECAAIASSARSFAPFDAVVFGASLDTVETNRAFAESVGIGFPLLSDPDGRVARDYGVLGRLGLPNRWTYYIGIDGRILAVDRAVRVGSHGADIVSTLERLRVSRRS
jgi:thioredoxin-dependent peroxiredoxin